MQCKQMYYDYAGLQLKRVSVSAYPNPQLTSTTGALRLQCLERKNCRIDPQSADFQQFHRRAHEAGVLLHALSPFRFQWQSSIFSSPITLAKMFQTKKRLRACGNRA